MEWRLFVAGSGNFICKRKRIQTRIVRHLQNKLPKNIKGAYIYPKKRKSVANTG
jgi:tartrate dehydratase beta subunit/fumarate hydratase class I family protein